jgi:hypothetical protein
MTQKAIKNHLKPSGRERSTQLPSSSSCFTACENVIEEREKIDKRVSPLPSRAGKTNEEAKG